MKLEPASVFFFAEDPRNHCFGCAAIAQRRPQHASIDIGPVLQTIRARGFESMVSLQIKGLYAVSYPILDTQNHALAALTVPYAERLDQRRRTVTEIEAALGRAAEALSRRMGWRGEEAQHFDASSAGRPAGPARKPTSPRQTAGR